VSQRGLAGTTGTPEVNSQYVALCVTEYIQRTKSLVPSGLNDTVTHSHEQKPQQVLASTRVASATPRNRRHQPQRHVQMPFQAKVIDIGEGKD
jgi:hypothetical protein